MTAAAASLVFISPIAWAQTPTEQNAQIVTSKSTLTLEQRHEIREIIKDLKIDSSTVKVHFAIGDTVSKSTSLLPMPPEVSARVSSIKSHLFFVMNGPSSSCRSEGQQDRRYYSVGHNKLQHETPQRFMLANDSVTVAIEILIWLTERDIAALEAQHGIELAPREGNKPRVLTGRIDFLQVRNGAIQILDYKHDARTNKPIGQLTIYALALTRLVPRSSSSTSSASAFE